MTHLPLFLHVHRAFPDILLFKSTDARASKDGMGWGVFKRDRQFFVRKKMRMMYMSYACCHSPGWPAEDAIFWGGGGGGGD